MSLYFDSDLQLLMNQLRQNEANSFTWEELAKLAKTNFMEKCNPLDSEDRARIQRGLEFLKRDLKVCNYKDLCDILALICSRVNLKFCISPASACSDLIPATASSPQFLSISNAYENFGLKIIPMINDNDSLVEKVQLFFADKSYQSLNTLCKILNQRTLNSAEDYLCKLSARFSFNDQKDVNSHIFQALKFLEHQLESYDKKEPVFQLVNYKDTGLFQPRVDGNFGCLHFFVHPRDMLSQSKRDFWAPTVDEFFQHPRGVWAEVGVECSPDNENLSLQCGPKNDKKDLPAVFFLSLSQPIVLSVDMIKKLTELTGRMIIRELDSMYKRNLYVPGFEPIKAHSEPKNAMESFGTEIFVPLKEQNHKYSFEYSKSNPNLQSFACSKVKFTNYSHVAPILEILRSSLNYFGALKSLEDHSKMEYQNGVCREEENQCLPFLISSSDFGKLEVLFQHPAPEDKRFFSIKVIFHSLMSETDVDVQMVGESKMASLSDVAEKIMRQFLCLFLTMRTIVKLVVNTEDLSKDFATSSRKRKLASMK